MAAVFKDILSAAFKGCDLNSDLNFAEQIISFFLSLFFLRVSGHLSAMSELNVDDDQGFRDVVRAKRM